VWQSVTRDTNLIDGAKESENALAVWERKMTKEKFGKYSFFVLVW